MPTPCEMQSFLENLALARSESWLGLFICHILVALNEDANKYFGY
jgi:hypothetical protein